MKERRSEEERMNETEIVIVTIITICPKLELVFQ